LTKDEFAKFEKQFSISIPEMDEFMFQCDLDGDGVIGFSDFLTVALLGSEFITITRCKEAFRSLDRDKDGYISIKDLQAGLY